VYTESIYWYLNISENFATGLVFLLHVDIEIPPNSVTLESEISNRHSRTKGDTINGNVYSEIIFFLKNSEKIFLSMIKRLPKNSLHQDSGN